MYGGMEVQCHPFLTLAVDGGSDHHHILAALLLDKGWMSPRAGLDAVGKRKVSPTAESLT
jgi:hypothetical protein